MLRMAQMINPETVPKSFRPRSSPFNTAETTCWWVNPFAGVKDRREASFKIDHAILAQIFGLLVRDPLQRLFGLHHRDGVGKAFQVLGETSLVRALMKPLRQRRRIAGGKFGVLRFFCQVNDGLRPQYAVEVLVQKHFG